jgi:hemoglobin/transferrin/lactoferrin receptor protein
MNRKLLTSLVLILFVGSISLNATARIQFANDSLTLTRQLSEITVSGIHTTKLNLPVQTVTAAEMDARALVSPGDVLHHVPGIVLSRDGAWATSINLRGFPESKLLFLSDGERMQSATDIAGVLSSVDLTSVERIEIIKGAGSVVFGTGALGGVVNFVMDRPDYSAERTVHGRVGTGLQSVNSLWHSHAAVSIAESNWYLQLDGALRTAGNYTTPEGELPNSQFNDANIGLRGGMRYDDNQELLVGYQHNEAWNVGLPGGGAFPATAEVRYLGFARNQLNGEYIFKDLTDVIQDLRFKAYTQNITREVENIVNPKTAIFPGSRNVTSGVRASADLYFNDYNTLTAGAEGWQRKQTTTRVRITTLNDTVFTGEQPTPFATMTDAGIFGHYRWVIDPNRWSLNAGMRLDYIHTANDTAFKEVYKYKLSQGERTTLPHDRTVLFNERNTHELAYAAHVDIAYQPTRNQSLVLSLANAYRAASMEERFKYIDQAGTLRVGNPNLKPEQGVFANLGYTYSAPRLFIKTDFFANYLFDMIAEKQGSHTLNNGLVVPAWVNANVDKALYAGSEVELKWLVAKGLDLETSIAYVYGEDLSTNELMPLLPPLNGMVKVNYHLMKKLNTSLMVEWEYQTETPDETVARHQYAVVNWLFDTAPRSIGVMKLQFAGGVRNLFDASYSAWFSTLRGINRLEPGRNFYVKTTVSW